MGLPVLDPFSPQTMTEFLKEQTTQSLAKESVGSYNLELEEGIF